MPTTSVSSASIDGRAQNPRFIQRQLRGLYNALSENAQVLQDAAIADHHISDREAAVEFSVAIDIVRRRFNDIDLRVSLEDEYRIANGKDWLTRRSPHGVVYIRPGGHTMLFSIVSALSAAIAAGNCVAVEMKPTTQETSRVLSRLLEQYMDQDTFAIADSSSSDQLLEECSLLLDQSASSPAEYSSPTLRTPPESSRVVAVVDRSADMIPAANAIARARLGYRGRSPYAPDVVLVNEFAMNDFIQATLKVLTVEMSRTQGLEINRGKEGKDEALTEIERSDPGTIVIMEGDHASIIKVCNRELSIMAKKVAGPCLIVSPVSSLDDAIDFANLPGTVSLASYIFAALPAAKYMSQFIESRASFINHIPIELQLGPEAPMDFPVSAVDRYRPEMFSTATPQFVQASRLTRKLDEMSKESNVEKSQVDLLRDLASTPLPLDDQRDGKVVGFFDQGLMTGATVFLIPFIGGLGVASYYGIRFGFRFLRRQYG